MKQVFCFLWCIAVPILKTAAQELKADTASLKITVDLPHFLYEGDRLEMAATITNSSNQELTGQATLQLADAITNISVDGWFQNIFPVQYFTVAAGKSEVVVFPVEVPYLFKKELRWKVLARAENRGDSTTAVIPILTNKVLVTETLHLPLQNGVHNYKFEKLAQADPTTEHHSLTFELFQNPIWHVVQALPSLADASDENALAVWNRFYAQMLAQKIRASSPQIQQTIDGWEKSDSAEWHANLQKQEKQHALLQNKPLWMSGATNKIRHAITALFDTSTLQAGQENSFQKLKGLQNSNGSFSWFRNGPNDRFITQSIVIGMGYLKRLKALTTASEEGIHTMLKSTLPYLDQEIAEDYKALINAKKDLKKKQITPAQIQYLYMRSFFTDEAMPTAVLPAHQFYQQQARQFWNGESKLLQTLIALALHRAGDTNTPAAILQALKKTTTITKQKAHVWNWWQNPVKEKAVLAEALNEIEKDAGMITTLQAALVSEKSLNNWQTTNSTTTACYALLLQPHPHVEKAKVQLKTGNITFSNAIKSDGIETDYFSETINAPQVNPDRGIIQIVTEQLKTTLALELFSVDIYWRYFQNSNATDTTAAAIKIRKELVVKRTGKYEPVNETTPLHIADTVLVRLTITSKHNLNHIQISDGFAAATAPTNPVKGYLERNRFGYYQNQQSTCMFFFLPLLKSGITVLEYPLLVTHAGAFSTGATMVQSLYAPGILTYSDALRIQVE